MEGGRTEEGREEGGPKRFGRVTAEPGCERTVERLAATVSVASLRTSLKTAIIIDRCCNTEQTAGRGEVQAGVMTECD